MNGAGKLIIQGVLDPEDPVVAADLGPDASSYPIANWFGGFAGISVRRSSEHYLLMGFDAAY